VPAGAAVWFESVRTRQTGAERYFFSPPLTPGATYAYEVEARWNEDGKPVERQRQIVVHAETPDAALFRRSPEPGR
jgi:uncharacterized protein (TIGR03000 family)